MITPGTVEDFAARQDIGADGVMIEVHPDPDSALCDGPLALSPAEFSALTADLRALTPALARPPETVGREV